MDAIGLMSGTSMDGVDAVLARIVPQGDGIAVESRDFLCVPYTPALLSRLRRTAAEEPLSAEELGALDVEVGEAFAGAALTLLQRPAARAARVEVIGSHGQTVAHAPARGVSVQLGCPAVIAERTELPVVADFRARDLAAGGQGAPLVPIVDRLLFTAPGRTIGALNLGGIANLTVLPPGGDPVKAWDIGPANMVLDGLVQDITGGAKRHDRDGAGAKRGRVSGPLLQELLADPYFALPPPKSTGADRFGARYVAELRRRGRALAIGDDDLLATAAALTIETVAAAIRTSAVERVVASGGGVHNPILMSGLGARLAGIELVTSDAYGIDPDAKEAMAFAILAFAHLSGRPCGLPTVTGARRATVLGTLTPGSSR
jgi:anhydro-N-acetylmuramic acid kinase